MKVILLLLYSGAGFIAVFALLVGLLIGSGVLLLKVRRLERHRADTEAQLIAEQETRKQLTELEKVKIQFFNNVAHEFRSPLTLILEPVRQMLRDTHERTMSAKLRLIESNSQRLLTLINQLLDFSKLESSGVKPNLSKGNLVHIIRPIYQSFFVLADSKSIGLHFKADTDLVDFYFDRVMVEKIVSNLLSNAIKFTGAAGKVDLKIARETMPSENGPVQSLVIIVEDTGVGIAAAYREKIFDRFKQIENGAASPTEGSGIGLTLVKEFTELHGGKVFLESEEGRGSTFKVFLPLVMEMPNAVTDAPTASATEAQVIWPVPEMNGNTAESVETDIATERFASLVLLVENDVEMRQFLKDILLVQGYQVIEASNGEEGIDKAYKLIPDLIVTDLKMPGKDGTDLLQVLKNNERTSLIPIVVLTARLELDHKIACLKLGADAYLTKPFLTEELTAHIGQLLHNRKKAQSKKPRTDAPLSISAIEQGADAESNFLRTLSLVIEQNIENESLGVQQLADAMALSRTHLYRKVKTLTDQNVLDFIRNYRLDRAKQMLQNQEGKVNEVAHKTGFPSPKHFSRVFKERFGVSPGTFK